MDPVKLAKVSQTLEQIDQLRNELQELLHDDPELRQYVDQLKSLIIAVHRGSEHSNVAAFSAAAARVNFENNRYLFLRAIDGDTILLDAPQHMKPWLQDIRVRLYGVDTPEMSEPKGDVYQKLVEKICHLSNSEVSVVWDRERGTHGYPDFPKASFEREVGHVFIHVGGEMVYLNALLAMMPHVKATNARSGESLLKGYKHLSSGAFTCPTKISCVNCGIALPEALANVLESVADIGVNDPIAFPKCLCIMSSDLIHASTNGTQATHDVLRSTIRSIPCAYLLFRQAVEAESKNFAKWIENGSVSVFDSTLLLAFQWRDTNRNEAMAIGK